MKLYHKVPDINAPLQPGEVEFTPLQLTRMRWTAINFQNFVMLAALMMVVAGALAVGVGWSNIGDIKATNHRQDSTDNRIKALVVGVCAVPNVNRIIFVNSLKREEAFLKKYVNAPDTAIVETFKPTYDDLQVIDCKAGFSKGDQAKICLEYPTTIPDDPTAPTTPTTNQPACK